MSDNLCGSCGYDHDNMEIEYCDCGEHCEYCAQLCPECDVCGCWGECVDE